MADLLKRGAEWLSEKRHAHMTSEVLYSRGDTSILINATFGRVEFEQADEQGFITKIQGRDFLIRRDDLSVLGEPRKGDRIRVETDVRAEIYEVMSPAGVPVFKWSDLYHRTFRVHTKHVLSEE